GSGCSAGALQPGQSLRALRPFDAGRAAVAGGAGGAGRPGGPVRVPGERLLVAPARAGTGDDAQAAVRLPHARVDDTVGPPVLRAVCGERDAGRERGHGRREQQQPSSSWVHVRTPLVVSARNTGGREEAPARVRLSLRRSYVNAK